MYIYIKNSLIFRTHVRHLLDSDIEWTFRLSSIAGVGAISELDNVGLDSMGVYECCSLVGNTVLGSFLRNNFLNSSVTLDTNFTLCIVYENFYPTSIIYLSLTIHH